MILSAVFAVRAGLPWPARPGTPPPFFSRFSSCVVSFPGRLEKGGGGAEASSLFLSFPAAELLLESFVLFGKFVDAERSSSLCTQSASP
jgi:hypothetical protein